MDRIKEINNEQEKIDNYIITTCITLLAAYVVFLSIKKPDSVPLVYAVIVTIFSLSLTLLESLWHKFRNHIRNLYFDEQREKIISEYSTKITNFIGTVFDSSLKVNLIKLLPISGKDTNEGMILQELIRRPLLDVDKEQNKKGSPSDVMLEAFEKTAEQTKESIGSMLKNMVFESREAYETAFKKPLQEKNKKLKFFLDIVSRNTRHYFFILGIVSFFISFILNLLSK